MKFSRVARFGKFVPNSIQDEGDRQWQCQKRLGGEQGDYPLAGAGIGHGLLVLDASSLPFGNFDPAPALQLIKCHTEGVAADLQFLAKLAFARQTFPPASGANALTQALRRLSGEGDPLRQGG